MKDQLALMYVKDNIGYPVSLNKEQQEIFQLLMNLMPQPINYIKDHGVIQISNYNIPPYISVTLIESPLWPKPCRFWP